MILLQGCCNISNSGFTGSDRNLADALSLENPDLASTLFLIQPRHSLPWLGSIIWTASSILKKIVLSSNTDTCRRQSNNREKKTI